MIEARALVALSMAGEQHPADAIEFSAFLAVETSQRASIGVRIVDGLSVCKAGAEVRDA